MQGFVGYLWVAEESFGEPKLRPTLTHGRTKKSLVILRMQLELGPSWVAVTTTTTTTTTTATTTTTTTTAAAAVIIRSHIFDPLPTACSCNMVGTNRTSCDLSSGHCSCHDGVVGRACSTCRQHYYNFNSGAGCSPCNCNALYSQDLQCNSAGKCTCKAGVSEDKCTKCADNYYNLTTAGVYLVSI